MRIALFASRRLRHGPMSPLLRFARDFMPFLEQHEIVTTDGCYRAFLRSGLFWSHPSFQSAGSGYQGALVRITSGVVPGASKNSIDAVIYLVDPRDPSSNYPETNALKRECVVHQRPFLATSRSARLWATLNWESENATTLASHTINPSSFHFGESLATTLSRLTVALIAHDDKKSEILQFSRDHFEFLRAFKHRVGTGTTGALLNGDKPDRLSKEAWQELSQICTALKSKISAVGYPKGCFVTPLRSGPEGGDVQIARMILDGDCHCIIFFEDPKVARQHEQDIQLLERTGRTRGKDVVCVHDPKTASDLAKKWVTNPSRRDTEPLLIATALERRFHVKPILVDGRDEPWQQILDAASWYLLAQVAALASDRKKRGENVKVTVSWGKGLSEVVERLAIQRKRLIERDSADSTWRSHIGEYPHSMDFFDDRYFKPGNVEVGPMQGIMAAADDAVEANAIARVVADFFGGKHIELALAALMSKHPTSYAVGRRQIPEEVMDHWDKTDILITTCAPVRREFAGHVRAPGFENHFEQVEKAACGDIGGIYLKSSGEKFDPDRFQRIGMNEEQIRRVRERGGQAVLIAGAEQDREQIAFTILETRLMSTLITNQEFATNLLRMAPLRNADR